MPKLLLITALVLLFLCANACRCVPKTLRRAFVEKETKLAVRAKVIAVFSPCTKCTVADQNKKRFFLLRIQRTFKGCSEQKLILVNSFIGSSLCGALLQKKSYLFYLPDGFLPMINSCMFIRLWSNISAADKEWLGRRTVCCGKSCKCANGDPFVNCFVAPCLVANKKCLDLFTCRDNYCGGCIAEFFDSKGFPVTCPPTS